MADDVYTIVTNRIVEALEEGTIPWHKPWGEYGAPVSLASGKAYRGLNPLILNLAAAERGFADPRWVTFKGAQAAGGNVRKGARSEVVAFWKWIDKRDDSGDKVPLLRYYRVFNVEETDLDLDPLAPRDFAPIEAAEELLAGYVDVQVKYGGDRAYYSPVLDYIGLPVREAFDTPASFYSTAFHEAVHSTGHWDRLGRFDRENLASFGSESYGKEELVAEIGSAYCMGFAGLVDESLDASAAYIAGWLAAIRKDRRLILGAAGQAQKAVDRITGSVPDYALVEA